MPVRIVCPSCSAALSVKDELAGRALKCPKCGGVIPASQTATPNAAPPPSPSKSAPALQKPAFEEVSEPTKPAKTGSKVTGQPAPRVKKDDDEEEEDRPRRKKRDEDEEDEDRPRRKKRDEDDDDRIAKSKKRDDDDEEEDRPRRKKRDEDEEDEDRPRRKKRDEDEEDEEGGAKGRKGQEDEEGDEERPTKKRKKQDDEDEDEDEDDDDRPRGKKKKQKGGSKMGLIIGGIAGVLLLCCGGGGLAGYFLFWGSSNNEGKIVGKWKIISGPGMDAKQMESLGMSMIMEFKDDGTVAMFPQFSDPKMQKMVEASGEKTSFSWKYKLGSGDAVEFYDFPKELKGKKGGDGPFGSKERAKGNIKIDGDNMTINDEETMKTTPLKLTKVK